MSDDTTFDLGGMFSSLFSGFTGGGTTEQPPPPAQDTTGGDQNGDHTGLAKMFANSPDKGTGWGFKPATWVYGPLGLIPKWDNDGEAYPDYLGGPMDRADNVARQRAEWRAARGFGATPPRAGSQDDPAGPVPQVTPPSNPGQSTKVAENGPPPAPGTQEYWEQTRAQQQGEQVFKDVRNALAPRLNVRLPNGGIGEAPNRGVDYEPMPDGLTDEQKAAWEQEHGLTYSEPSATRQAKEDGGYGPPSGGNSFTQWIQNGGDGRFGANVNGKVVQPAANNTAAPQGVDTNSYGIPLRLTAYSPQAPGSRIGRMEGGYEASRAGPDGQAVVRTLADYAAGRSNYITIAGSPSQYGKSYIIPKISFMDARGAIKTLTNVKAVVHDTGGAFTTAPEGRYDVPIDRDANDFQMAANMRIWRSTGVRFIPYNG